MSATSTTAPTRRDWALLRRDAWRVLHVVVPGGVAVVVLRELDLVADTPIWAYLAGLLFAHLGSQLATVLFPPGGGYSAVWWRTLIAVGTATVPIYMSGLDAMLGIGYVAIASDQIRTDGARAARPVFVWSLLSLAIGELFVELDIAPSLLSEGREHGLAVLVAIVLAPATLMFANVAGERERSARTSSRLLDLAHALAQPGTRREIAQRLADAVPHVLGLQRALVALRDGDDLRVIATHGYPPDLDSGLRNLPLLPDNSPIVAKLFHHPRITYLTRDVDDPFIRATFERFGAVEAFAAPIVVGDDGVIGLIVADRTKRPATGLTPALRQRLGGLADQAAVALNNARRVDHERDAIEQLREADRLKSEFLAIVSHELRTPLSVMMGAARTLQWRVDELDETTRGALIESIVRRGEQLNRLVEDLLQASGDVQLVLGPVDVAAVVRTAVSDAATLHPDAAITCTVPDDDVIVRADAFRVRQVVDNLIENACKYGGGGSVAVAVAWHDDEARISVADEGPGMSEEQVGRAFDAFYQGDSSAVRNVGGLGLGLHICRRIVDAHGGRIWIDSAIGAGTRVNAAFPANGPDGA